MAPIGKILGENIARERASRGLSQADVAAALDIRPLTVHRWEASKSWPSAENIEGLAKVLKVEAWRLFVPSKAAANPKVRDALNVVARSLGYTLATSKGRS